MTAFLLLALAIIPSGGTMAAGVTGTYTSTVPGEGYSDSTYPADFTYDAKLTLNSGGSGSLWLKCTDVVVNVAGWESAYDMLGRSQTVSVNWVMLGSSVTVTIHDGYGGNYPLTVNFDGNNRLSGSGTYVDSSYVSNSWTMDVKKGGSSAGSVSFGFSGLAGLAGIAAAGGFVVGFFVSLLPPPRYMGGSIMPQNNSPLGTPYAPSQSIGSMANQSGVTRPLPDVPRMRMFEPMQFPNVEMGRTTDIRPTEIHGTDVLSKRSCPNCGSTLIATAAGWSCPFCNRPPPGGLDR